MTFNGIDNQTVELKITNYQYPDSNDVDWNGNWLSEIHMITGGDISNVINGLLYAKAQGIPLTFQEAANLDLRKFDVISHLKANTKVF